jgi:hypothetical protein
MGISGRLAATRRLCGAERQDGMATDTHMTYDRVSTMHLEQGRAE